MPDVLQHHGALTRRQADLSAQIQRLNRRLKELLVAYLPTCRPGIAEVPAWRWDIRRVGDDGVLFGHDSFFFGFDDPACPKEILVPAAWIRTQV